VLRILVHVDETKGLAARALEEAGGVGCLISCAVVKQGSQLKGVAVPAKGRRRCGAPPAPSTASAVFEEARLFQDIGEEEARDPVRGAADEHAARACEGRRQAFSVAASGRRRGRCSSGPRRLSGCALGHAAREEIDKKLQVDRGGHDDHAQVRPQRQHVPQNGQEEV